MKIYLLILFLGLVTMSHGQSIENLQKRLSLLSHPVEIKFDTTGFSKLPKLNYLCISDIVFIEPDGSQRIVPSETKDPWKYFSVIDLNYDGLNDLVYSGPCNPYDQAGIFINDGKNLQLVYDYPGAIISIERNGLQTTINILKNSLGCDWYPELTEVVVSKGSSLPTTNRIAYVMLPTTNFKKFELVKFKGVLRYTPEVDDADKKDPCSDSIVKGNHWLSVDKKASGIRIYQQGEWSLILYQKSKEESIIGWVQTNYR